MQRRQRGQLLRTPAVELAVPYRFPPFRSRPSAHLRGESCKQTVQSPELSARFDSFGFFVPPEARKQIKGWAGLMVERHTFALPYGLATVPSHQKRPDRPTGASTDEVTMPPRGLSRTGRPSADPFVPLSLLNWNYYVLVRCARPHHVRGTRVRVLGLPRVVLREGAWIE